MKLFKITENTCTRYVSCVDAKTLRMALNPQTIQEINGKSLKHLFHWFFASMIIQDEEFIDD